MLAPRRKFSHDREPKLKTKILSVENQALPSTQEQEHFERVAEHISLTFKNFNFSLELLLKLSNSASISLRAYAKPTQTILLTDTRCFMLTTITRIFCCLTTTFAMSYFP